MINKIIEKTAYKKQNKEYSLKNILNYIVNNK